MMINGIGVDIESTKRFKDASPEFLNLVFTPREIEYCKKKKEPHICFAGKFCAKEAVIKSFNKKISIKDVEIINEEEGMPQVYINHKHKKNIQCSISHTNEYAIAYVINEMSTMDNKIAEKKYVSDAPISSVSVQISTDKIYRLIEDKNRAEKVNVFFGDVVSSAIAKILPDYPELTKHLDVDLGYLVDIGKGLKIVVIKNASKKSLIELSMEIKEKILKYLHDELDETEKSSIIVNNLAPFKAFYVNPPIYSGMVATIVICSEYPAVEFEREKRIFIKKFNLVLSFDARAINCQRALEFLNNVKKNLETA